MSDYKGPGDGWQEAPASHNRVGALVEFDVQGRQVRAWVRVPESHLPECLWVDSAGNVWQPGMNGTLAMAKTTSSNASNLPLVKYTVSGERRYEKEDSSVNECDVSDCHLPGTAKGNQGFRWCDKHVPYSI